MVEKNKMCVNAPNSGQLVSVCKLYELNIYAFTIFLHKYCYKVVAQQIAGQESTLSYENICRVAALQNDDNG